MYVCTCGGKHLEELLLLLLPPSPRRLGKEGRGTGWWQVGGRAGRQASVGKGSLFTIITIFRCVTDIYALFFSPAA